MTGVTVVTTHDPDGNPIGFTANSFTSVSLDPPLVLVCIANSSSNYAAFEQAEGFAVNVLAEDQKGVSNTFARPVEDRFAAVSWQQGPQGSPVFEGVSAWFDCSMLCIRADIKHRQRTLLPIKRFPAERRTFGQAD